MLPVGQNPVMLNGFEVAAEEPGVEATIVKPRPAVLFGVRPANAATPFAPVTAMGFKRPPPAGHGFAPSASVTVAPDIGAPWASRARTCTAGNMGWPLVTL